MIRCSKCGGRAIIHQRYSGMHLCRTHFEGDVNRKVRETLRMSGLFAQSARVAVGLSGDAKSATLLCILKSLFFRRRDIEFTAIVIDEGIEGRRGLLAGAISLAGRLEIPCIMKRLRDAPKTAAEEIALGRFGWSFHAAMKRDLLRRAALDAGADALATGESLDDEAEKVFWSCLKGDIEGLVEIGQHKEREAGSGPLEIRPLRKVPVREIRLYARMNHIDPKEPVSCFTEADASRLEVRRMLNDFDSRHPGTKYSLLQCVERVVELQQSRGCYGDEAEGRAKPLSEGIK
ncbi:MAG: tRNA 2-thiocytidine biosynthesis protein TtcA [Methanosaeta sp. PtaU1.Bin060]|nr:MAG: tRNA 2-thiocytidine biosynthesis protein TtcA [Methanosaeta sp. PtaU1.Bin060]